MRVLVLCCAYGLISLSSWLFPTVLICNVFEDFYFRQSCGCFNFSIAVFRLLPVGFVCSQAHILSKLSVSMVSSH